MAELTISIPEALRKAGEAEARRRGLTLAELVGGFFEHFTPECIEAGRAVAEGGAACKNRGAVAFVEPEGLARLKELHNRTGISMSYLIEETISAGVATLERRVAAAEREVEGGRA